MIDEMTDPASNPELMALLYREATRKATPEEMAAALAAANVFLTDSSVAMAKEESFRRQIRSGHPKSRPKRRKRK